MTENLPIPNKNTSRYPLRVRIISLLPLPLLCVSCVSLYTGAARPADPAILNEAGWAAVTGVPDIRQEQEQDCGAAALAMVLAKLKRPLSVEEIRKACPPDPSPEIAIDKLRDLARSRGLESWRIEGNLNLLLTELEDFRPVIVGLVKPTAAGTITHYEVVVAIHRDRREVVTLDPARGLTVTSWPGFIAEWDPAMRLMLVVGVPPGK